MSNNKSRFRLHWGNALALSFVFFGIFIVVLVVGTFRQTVDLIEENYYDAEVMYQGRMEEMSRVEALPELPSLTQQDARLIIFVPGNHVSEGKAVFKRPNNAKLDFEVPLSAGETTVEPLSLIKGSWVVEVSWVTDGLKYFKKFKHYHK